MSTNLKELSKLPILKDSVLLTNPSTVDQNVNWVYLGDTFPNIADIESWVEPGNLLILIGHFISIGNYTLSDVIDLAHKMQLSGIIVFESDYICPIHEQDIRKSNTYNLPLMTIPWKIPYNELNKALLTRISLEQVNSKTNIELLNNILFNPHLNYDQETHNFIDTPLSLNSKNVILTCHIDLGDHVLDDFDIQNIYAYFLRIVTQTMDQMSIDHLSINRGSDIIVLMPAQQCDKMVHISLDERLTTLMQVKYESPSIYVGIGGAYSHPKEYTKSYTEGCHVIKAKQSGLLLGPILQYCDLDFYRLLFEINDTELLRKLYPQRLTNLIAHDKSDYGLLMQTLESYLKNNRSINKAASELFVHKNTVSYRIEKIKELIHVSLDEEQIDFALMTEIAVCRYLYMMNH